jgi:predicted ArsR family transcriptional regulator
MQITRSKILNYLQHNPGKSAAELGRVLEMTPANMRYHLDILLDQGEVQISGQRPAGGAGRPIHLYNLSSQTLGDSLPALLQAVFASLEKHPDPDPLLEMIASSLADKHLPGKNNRVTLYNLAVEYLKSFNYHASWGAHPEGPRVELRHCPYGDLARTNPKICQVDQILLSKLFQIPLILTQKRVFGNNPFSPCVFQTSQGS